MEIAFRDVHYTYDSKSPFRSEALKGVDFSFDSTDFIALVGHTGSGKSTIIEHLNGLLVPTAGEVVVGEFINTKDKKRRTKKVAPLRRKIGLVFQFSENQLFEDNVLKDVMFGPKNFGANDEEAREKAKAALSLVGIGENYYKRSPFELSGGEKRRVAIAGILAIDPEVLVLDEPTSGLDPEGAKEMMDLFQKIHKEGKGIVLVTHDMDIVLGYAEKVAVTDDGKIAMLGEPKSVFKNDLSRYGLEKPMVYKALDILNAHGYRIDIEGIETAEGLAKAIKEDRHGL